MILNSVMYWFVQHDNRPTGTVLVQYCRFNLSIAIRTVAYSSL
jgi:hypothetical protein